MKKKLSKIIIAVLVFAFVVGIAPVGFVADLFNNVVYAAEQDYNLQKVDGQWLYFNNKGEYDESYVGLAKNEWGWWYVKDGTIDFTFTGMAKNAYGWWHVTNGKLDLKYTGIDSNEWGSWYMKNGKLDKSFTGMAKDSYGWRYLKNGKVVENYTGMAKNAYGWWYFTNGRIDYLYVGLAKNDYGWWYIENGTINFKYNGKAENQYGWWNVKNGKVTTKTQAPNPSKEAGTLGFLWNDDEEVFYSANDPWQRNWGYNAVYDWAAQLVVLYYDTVRIKFNYGGYDWLVQLWKGQYGFVLVGEELGVYYKDEGTLIEHYKCDDNSMRLKAGYVCYDNGEVLFTRKYQSTWWLTGFVPGKLKRFNDRTEMAMQGLITLKDSAMCKAFVGGLEKAGFKKGRANIDDPDTYYTDGISVHFFWQYLADPTSLI